MTSCGVWLSRRGLVAVVADDNASMIELPFTASRTDDARWALLTHVEAHHGLNCALVLCASLARSDPLAMLAAKRGGRVWIVRDEFVDNLCLVAGLRRVPPKRLALMLARLPLCTELQKWLEPIRMQLPLFR